MSRIIRDILYKKISNCLNNTDPKAISTLISNSSLHLDKNTKSFYILLYPKIINNFSTILQDLTIDDIYFEDINFVKDNDIIKQISLKCSRHELIKSILDNNIKKIEPPTFLKNNKNIIVEFSSPNIAKPFHVGHLRSTIIGNYVSNINSYFGNRVRKINYLGDWGTQFGLVILGLSECNAEEMMKNPIQTLYNAYVKTNKLSEFDPSIKEKAKNIFENMEKGNSEYFEKWQKIKNYTVQELSRTYKRIGVVFDEYHWESMYNAKNIKDILLLIENHGLFTTDDDNRRVITINNKNVPLIKSDGSTLYLTRDVAAAIDRFKKYNFDFMYYVVDNSQTGHFTNLIAILKSLEFPWVKRLEHVKFGRINGMSTRQGKTIFLEDLLNEINSVMYQKQLQSSTTKVQVNAPNESTDILGISAIIVNDFKQKRNANYNFNWNEALDSKGQSGVKLQYSHARLASLEENCGVEFVFKSDPTFLQEPCIDNLILILGQFDEVLYKSYQSLEPYILTKYLFQLSHSINIAFKELKIKGEPEKLASQRLLLFQVAKQILAQGLKLLGITPLSKM